jgi:hypothetical protein
MDGFQKFWLGIALALVIPLWFRYFEPRGQVRNIEKILGWKNSNRHFDVAK